MTLLYELDLYILKMYLHIKVNSLRQRFHKSEHYSETDGQTDATKRITYHAAFAGCNNVSLLNKQQPMG